MLFQGQGASALHDTPVFKKHTPIPARQNRSFQMAADQTSFILNVLYKDGVAGSAPLGKVRMSSLSS